MEVLGETPGNFDFIPVGILFIVLEQWKGYG